MNDDKNTLLAELSGLVKTEEPNLRRYASCRLGDGGDAKDAVQDAFLKMYLHVSQTDASKINDIRCYLFKTLSNICVTRLQRQSKHRTIPISGKFDTAEPQDESHEQELRRISRLLAMIPENQAEVIRLRIYGNNSFAEIAAILAVPLPTVKSRFLYGLEKIRREMKKG